MTRKITTDEFWTRVDKTGDCWNWTGSRLPTGFGRVGRSYAHHRAYELMVGAIPPGLELISHCRNRSCVRPDHHFIGTAKDRVSRHETRARISASRKKTALRGAAHYMFGTHLSAERRAHLSAVKSGRRLNLSPERRDQLRRQMTGNRFSIGRTWSPENRVHMATIFDSADWKKKASASHHGYVPTPATRQKMSAAGRLRRHTEEEKRKIGDANRGRVWSAESRAKAALAMAKRIEHFPKITSLNHALYAYLGELGLEYVPEKRFGRYIVDAYVPATNSVYEADGSFWHKDKERQARRDDALLKQVREVIHLDEKALGPWWKHGRRVA